MKVHTYNSWCVHESRMCVLLLTCVLASVFGEGVSRATSKTTQVTQIRLLSYRDRLREEEKHQDLLGWREKIIEDKLAKMALKHIRLRVICLIYTLFIKCESIHSFKSRSPSRDQEKGPLVFFRMYNSSLLELFCGKKNNISSQTFTQVLNIPQNKPNLPAREEGKLHNYPKCPL